MKDNLTQEQAEKFARILKFKSEKEAIWCAADGSVPEVILWMDTEDNLGYYALPLEPHCWFMKLFEAGLYHKSYKKASSASCFLKSFQYTVEGRKTFSIREMCLILCEILEDVEAVTEEE